MLDAVNEVRAVRPDRLWIRFADGVQGKVDLPELIGRGVFRPLLDPAVFVCVGIDAYGAVCWPNDTDLAPDAMNAASRSDGHWRPSLATSTLPA